MEWEQLLSTVRVSGAEKLATTLDPRTPYECDVDRIVFSSGFRRLSKKTQVHPFSKSDHIHNRLTHSLEVAQVGRTLGKCLYERLDPEQRPAGVTACDMATIVRAACLAHDLGNPPFGHAGEAAISQWFESTGADLLAKFEPRHAQDLRTFEGNAQGLRMITQTENHLFEGGLRLTAATLGAFLKYPWVSSAEPEKQKFGAFIAEAPVLEWVAEETGLEELAAGKWCRHPLAYMTEAADDICYATLDIEDAVELGVVAPDEAYQTLLSVLDSETRDRVRSTMVEKTSYRVNFSRIRGPVYDALIGGAVKSFLANYDSIMSGTAEGALFGDLSFEPGVRAFVKEAKKLGREKIYTEQYKSEIELGCYSVFETLLEGFCKAALEKFDELQHPVGEVSISWKSSLILRQMGSHTPSNSNQPRGEKWSRYLCLRRVVDYISGMTDNYASDLARRINGDPTR